MWRDADHAAERALAPFCALLRRHRVAAGLTQEALAERAGLSVRAIQNLERGDRRPYPDTATRLADALGLGEPARAAFEAAGRPPPRPRDAAAVLPAPVAEKRPRVAGGGTVTYLFSERGRAMNRAGIPGARGAGGDRPAAGLPPTNLPATLTNCIGREAERAEVARLLSTARLVTLTGPGGCGKTRVALQIAADLATPARATAAATVAEDTGVGEPQTPTREPWSWQGSAARPEFVDGVWLVELDALSDPALVPQAVAEVLGVHEVPGRALAASLTDAVRRRRLLLVLDNCEHLLAACARLVHGLLRAAPSLRLLATSRLPLGLPGEVVRPVPPLGLPPEAATGGVPPDPEALLDYPAVRLFVARAAAAAPGFTLTARTAPAVARICRRLDGLPLALELAAARVRGLPPEYLAGRLDQPFQVLAPGSPAAAPHQRTLRAAVDWSYDLLEGSAQALFRRLAVFSGGWTLEAAEAICTDDGSAAQATSSGGESAGGKVAPSSGIGRADVPELLLGLVDASLVIAGPEPDRRYVLLETLRQYAGERLEASGEAEPLRERHAGYFLALARRGAPEHGRPASATWLDQLEQEHDNLRAALRWYVERSDTEQGLALGTTLSAFWRHRGYLTEGRAQLRTLLALPSATPASPQRVLALQIAGELAHLQADYAAARALGEEGLALRRALGDQRGIAGLLSYLGVIVREQGDYPAARDLLEESLRLDRAAKNRDGMAHGYIRLGEVAQALGDYELAQQHYEASQALFEALGTPWGRLSHHFGLLALDRGDVGRARSYLVESLRLQEAKEEREWLSSSLAAFAGLAAAEGQPQRTLRLAGVVDALQERQGAVLQPTERGRFERCVAGARQALSLADANAAWEAGRAMTPDQAVAYALGEDSPPGTLPV